MPKIDKLLILLELLYNRPIVPMSDIVKECRITERTGYRYIGTLQDANFAIEYDANCGGYHLIGRNPITARFTDSELTMLYYGTLLLEHLAAESALDSIKSARVKLESRVSLELQHVLSAGKEALLASTTPPGLREFVVLSMLLLAARREKPVKILYVDAAGERLEREIKSPKIIYSRGWAVSEEGPNRSVEAIAMRQILDVELSLKEEKSRRTSAAPAGSGW
jgi:predicted DNA-binding transcriptional regulator YafY